MWPLISTFQIFQMNQSSYITDEGFTEKHRTDGARAVITANSSFHTDMDFNLEDLSLSSPISRRDSSGLQHYAKIECSTDIEEETYKEIRPCRTESWGQYEFLEKNCSEIFDSNRAIESLQPSRRESIDKYEEDQADDLLLIFQMEL